MTPIKAYCKSCGERRQASFRPGNDAVSGEAFEDLCCDTCHFVIATISGRAQMAQAAPKGYTLVPTEGLEWLKQSAASAIAQPAEAQPVAYLRLEADDNEKASYQAYSSPVEGSFPVFTAAKGKQHGL